MRVAPALLLAGLLAARADGQSLGEAAKREQERRQAQPRKPSRTFTDSDLAGAAADHASGGASSEPTATPSPSPSPVEDPSSLPDDEAERKQLQALWRARFAEARAKLRTAESRAYEDRVGVAWKAGIPYQTMIREPVETEELRSARRALADLEEEFRRTGLPPGWSRE